MCNSITTSSGTYLDSDTAVIDTALYGNTPIEVEKKHGAFRLNKMKWTIVRAIGILFRVIIMQILISLMKVIRI